VVGELEQRTEGWVAGLQLAALSLRTQESSTQFLAGFKGSERKVADYLLQEVYAQQEPVLQNFLLQTSILDRFNSKFCDDLLGRTASQDLIDEIEQRSLFLIPLDSSRHWFRYHHLFSEFLRYRLARDWPQAEIAGLHRRAADWYERQELIEEAIQQRFQIEEYEEIARLIASLSINFLYKSGGSLKLLDWGLKLPKDVLRNQALAAVMLVGAALISGNMLVLREYFELIQDDESVQPYVDLFNSILVRNQKGDHAQALSLALRAAASGADLDPAFTPLAWMQVAVNHANLGQLEDVDEAISKMVQSIEAGNALDLSIQIYATEIQVVSALAQGDYPKAEQLCLAALAGATDGERLLTPLVGIIYSYLGNIYHQWNDFPRAKAYYDEAIGMARQSGISDMNTYSSVLLANLSVWQHDQTGLTEALASFVSLAENAQLERMQIISARMAAWFWLRIGQLDTAVEWARQAPYAVSDQPEFVDFDTYYTLIAVLLEEDRRARGTHDLDELMVLLKKLETLAAAAHHRVGLIDVFILKALLLDYQKDSQAVAVLQQALELAKPGRMLRTFVEWGPPMQALLVKAVSSDPGYVGQLLKVFEDEKEIAGSEAPAVALTERENEVLQLIAAGLPNKQIEATLMISNNTVRTHIKNLYGKLAVNSRTQAIQRARELSLID
jgi:LuxR family maltose regulon positive regulatory protein